MVTVGELVTHLLVSWETSLEEDTRANPRLFLGDTPENTDSLSLTIETANAILPIPMLFSKKIGIDLETFENL